MQWDFFAVDSSGKVALKDENFERWIDRINVPDYAITFYNTLVEGADNDNKSDVLIDISQESDNRILITESEFTSIEQRDALISEVGGYVRAVFDAFDRDHPEVFWLTGKTKMGMSFTGSDNGTIWFYFVLHSDADSENGQPEFNICKKEYQDSTALRQAIQDRETYISSIGGQGSTFEKIKYFNNWLTMNNEYNTIVSGGGNTDKPLVHECLSALKGSIGEEGPVCEGYARAFKVLCDRAGIPCVLTDGHARSKNTDDGEAHMWNFVQIDGSWYVVDVTWNDPTGGNAGKVSGFEREDWLLVGSETIIEGMDMTVIESHPIENSPSDGSPAFINGPVLSETSYVEPTEAPDVTTAPTEVPDATTAPTEAPTESPSATAEPTTDPTAMPTEAPTTAPTAAPPIEENPTPRPVEDLTYVDRNYYFYEDGEMAASKEAYVDGAWRWFDEDGTMAMDKDVYQASNGGKWVRYNENGEMVKGEDYRYGGWYYFEPVTGAMAKGPMILEDGRQVYYDTVTGQMLKGEQNINGQTYYFDEADGHLISGENTRVWVQIDGRDYWYEDWNRQGWDVTDASYRGKEIYDPASDAWYWLDSVQQGAKAVSKDVYQESYSAYPDREDGTGKWVRYDENGRMVKGWDTTDAGTYYFEEITGAMAKGRVTIDGREYYFDPVTGIRQD